METHLRSIVKALSWRFIGIICTCFVAWCITGSVYAGLAIGLMDGLIKLGVYYLHERGWQKVKWGITKHRMIEGDGGGI